MNFLRRLFGQPSAPVPAEKTPSQQQPPAPPPKPTVTPPVTAAPTPPAPVAEEVMRTDITAMITLMPGFGVKPESSDSSSTQTATPASTNLTNTSESGSPVMTSSANGASDPMTPHPSTLPDDSDVLGATRQLPPIEPYVSKPGKHVIFGINSDVGIVRTSNQDALYANFGINLSSDEVPDFGLFVVADGMGGHHDGEKASALATRIIAKYVNEHFYLNMLYGNSDDQDTPIISEVLNDAVLKANQMIGEKVPEGGTTCTAAIVLSDLAYIAHVGDSRAYLISTDGIEQLTRDHSLVQRLIELDQLTPEEAANHPQRNVLYRALGQNESIDVDTITRRLPAGSYLLLCSDGLWNHVPEAQMIHLVRTSKTPQEACDGLVAKANERGGLDNITVVLAQLPG
jgi:PPM family protein phosphatase